jgi:thiol-disulfide isomerase/thioredoxin
VLVVAVVMAAAYGFYRVFTDGRFRGTHRVRGVSSAAARGPAVAAVLADTEYADALGEKATLVQFSSAFCAPCRVARRVLSEVAAADSGIAHLEIDAEHHLELVRRLGILRTPTTLVLDARGAEISRASGAPTTEQVRAVLGALK